MKKLIFLSIVAISLAFNAFAQVQPPIPKLDINPDPFVQTHKVIDSIVQYIYPEQNDSSFLYKWLYNHFKEGDSHEAVTYYWNPALRAWSLPRGKYVYGFDPEGRLQVQAHYTYRDAHGNWKGCDSDGCGKKEWFYDSMGNQILRTQSYWVTNVTDWREFEIWENLYDLSGNMVLESSKYLGRSDYSDWYGSKNEFSYDAVGNQTGHVSYVWSGGDPYDWRPNFKKERSYDSNGNITMFAVYTWQGRWIGRFYWYYDVYDFWWTKVEFKYDSNGRKISVLLYKWDYDLNKWIFDFEEENKYDADGLLISEMEIQFSNDYVINPARKEYGYDAKGNRIAEITTSWLFWSVPWGNKVKNEFAFDSSGKKVLETISNWDGQAQSWLKSGKYEYAFDPSGNEVLYILYEWDSGKNDWVGSRKTEHVYDKSGKMILLAYYGWDNNSGAWKGDSIGGKKEWGYDSNGRLISEVEYIWNTEDKEWQGKLMLDAIYDTDGDPCIYSQNAWNPDSREWEKVLGYFFHYKSVVTGKPEIFANDIQVYPNPTEGQLTISGLSQPADILLYSIQGQLLKTYTGVKGGIDISDLPTGVYLLKLTWGNNTIVKKTVIKK